MTSPNSFECPVCGAEVPKGARSCRECGADERTGWNEEATRYDGIEFPDTVERELDHGNPGEKAGRSGVFLRPGARAFTWLVAVLVLAGVIAVVVG
ncbi:zinc ribbon domain-containing protein [Nibricoccus sp. IMCC34717]|uniref:zinc ribbon domain-containing protein n=1 Tax=Nibricoccus sp. IMCC34717 TaxID=3034021 RepID=UPI003850CA97